MGLGEIRLGEMGQNLT